MVKTLEVKQLVADLEETFSNLQANQIMLNPEKCVFGVLSGKLLEFIVSSDNLLHPLHRHQVLGPRRLCGRIDGGAYSCVHQAGVLDYVF